MGIPELITIQWIQFGLCGLLLGMSKTGLSGAGLMVVPIMANIFGGRESVGIVLPMLLVADVFAVIYYHRHANWKHILRLVPAALVGIIIGVLFGKALGDQQFNLAIAALVIGGIILMVWLDFRKNSLQVPDRWLVAGVLGILGGFTSMVGNAAGPIFTLYLLAMHLPKNRFIGTGAWFYLLLNLMKVPFHVFSWKTIHAESLILNALVVPALALGAFIGFRIVKIIPEKAYRIFIIASTLVASVFLFV